MFDNDKFVNLICDILVGERALVDYATDLGEVRMQISTAKKIYGSGSREVQELESIAVMIEGVIKHKLYEDKIEKKGSLHLSVVK